LVKENGDWEKQRVGKSCAGGTVPRKASQRDKEGTKWGGAHLQKLEKRNNY